MPTHAALRIAIAVACAAAAVAQASPPIDAAGFDAGYAGVRELMLKARWADAKQALLDLLQAHDQQVYVQAQADAIAADYASCAFYSGAKPVAVADIITGKIDSYDKNSGKLKVTYAGDFADWEGDGELLFNPIVFAGNYTVTASKSAYPARPQSFRLVFDADPSGECLFIADFGFATYSANRIEYSLDATVTQYRGENDSLVLFRDRGTAKPGEPFTAVVRVADDRVELVLDKKSVAKGKRDKTEFGQVGIWKGSCDRIVLEGKIEPSFVQGRIDEELAKQREAFDAKFDAKRELPQWVFARPAVVRTAPRSSSWVPAGERGVSKAFHEMLEVLQQGAHADAEARLAKLGDEDAPPVARAFIAALLQLRAGYPERAEAACARLLAEDPQQSQTRTLRAEALEDMGAWDDAGAELEAVLRDDPGFVTAWEQLCVLRLRQGRGDDARRLVRDAKTRHGLWDEVAGLERTLAMAARGPSWPHHYSHTSPHYEVVSDIDKKVCVEACRVLEESYVSLISQLAWIKPDKNQPRFRVFLFSGEAGYQEYNKAIVGEAVPHTAGLYTPALKQLLIWNVPRRDDMVRTIRHEGFHQFLDRVMQNPPSWLNEGMAEFWETARRQQDRLQGGQVRSDHVATLVRSRKLLPKLEQFVYGDRGDFYANAQLRYAQGWALVHFLKKGPPTHAARLDKLWAELRTAKSTRAALDAAFAGVDWAKFEQDFWSYVASLK